jgi:DNA-binding HxlR family transcriptional regulator
VCCGILNATASFRRTVTPSIPPRVDYQLTELGESLLEPIHALGRWAVDNEDKVAEARAKFEQRAEVA